MHHAPMYLTETDRHVYFSKQNMGT